MQLELPVHVSPIDTWAATHLQPEAERLDRDGALLHQAWKSYVEAGFHELGGSRRPAHHIDFIPNLARISGAFASIALHQWLANQSLVVAEGTPWPRAGVAVGHLRRGEIPGPVWEGGKLSGAIPWMTGATAYDHLLVGFTTEDGREALAWVDAHDRPEFRHQEAFQTMACTSARNVRVDIDGLELDESEITVIGPSGSYGAKDPHGLLLPCSLWLGNLQASVAILDSGPRTAPKSTRLLEEMTTKLSRAIEPTTSNEERRAVRSEIGNAAMRMAALATLVSGPHAVRTDRQPQRLYREALFFNLIAQDESTVHSMAEHLLPSRI